MAILSIGKHIMRNSALLTALVTPRVVCNSFCSKFLIATPLAVTLGLAGCAQPGDGGRSVSALPSGKFTTCVGFDCTPPIASTFPQSVEVVNGKIISGPCGRATCSDVSVVHIDPQTQRILFSVYDRGPVGFPGTASRSLYISYCPDSEMTEETANVVPEGRGFVRDKKTSLIGVIDCDFSKGPVFRQVNNSY